MSWPALEFRWAAAVLSELSVVQNAQVLSTLRHGHMCNSFVAEPSATLKFSQRYC